MIFVQNIYIVFENNFFGALRAINDNLNFFLSGLSILMFCKKQCFVKLFIKFEELIILNYIRRGAADGLLTNPKSPQEVVWKM